MSSPRLGRLVLVLALVLSCAASAFAKEASPTKAYNTLVKKMRRVPAAKKAAAMKDAAVEWLDAFKAAGRTEEGKHLYSFALFQQAAERYVEAFANFRAVEGDKTVQQKTRDLAARNQAGLLLVPALRASMGPDAIKEETERLCAFAKGMVGDMARSSQLSKLRYVLADVHDRAGDRKAAHDMRTQIVADDPSFRAFWYGTDKLLMNAILFAPILEDTARPPRGRRDEEQ